MFAQTEKIMANKEKEISIIGEGVHIRIENRGDGIVYASKYPNVIAESNDVIAIDKGTTKLIPNVCVHSEVDNELAYRGNIYVLSTTETSIEITTTNNSNFSLKLKGGGSASTVLDDVLKSNRVYQLGILTSDITLTLPETANNDIEVCFAIADTTYNINCDYLQLNVVENTYYQVIFSYDKSLNTWFSSVVSSDYNVTSTTDSEEVTTNEN